MEISDLCKERRVVKANLKTPALIPSFSSRGFPKLKEMHHHLKEYTLDTSLVSAFDLHYNHLAKEDIYCSEVLFIDSGGYETGENGDLSDSYHAEPEQADWTAAMHLEEVKTLKPKLSKLVLVNFDEPAPYEEQFRRAREFFSSFPGSTSDFLIKPTEKKGRLRIDEVVRYASDLTEFNIIGITEKELGSSCLERCENIIKLRKALHEQKADTPIHIFGSLDPLSVLAYFLCGADVFDGLSWLRYAYHNGLAVYLNSYSIMDNQWSTDFENLKMATSIRNLAHLRGLRVSMRTFVKDYDWKAFDLSEQYVDQLKRLVKAAGVRL